MQTVDTKESGLMMFGLVCKFECGHTIRGTMQEIALVDRCVRMKAAHNKKMEMISGADVPTA